ncbi:ATP-binding protein, partial [Vibrio cholerae]|uniref:ATP-binding protein n=1 Tax=Vibrio cholerae TaxID=666 RepID=UPI001C3145DE
LQGERQSGPGLSLQSAPAWQRALPLQDILLEAEVADREVRSGAYQMSAARFPAYRDLYGFNFQESEVDERLVQDL